MSTYHKHVSCLHTLCCRKDAHHTPQRSQRSIQIHTDHTDPHGSHGSTRITRIHTDHTDPHGSTRIHTDHTDYTDHTLSPGWRPGDHWQPLATWRPGDLLATWRCVSKLCSPVNNQYCSNATQLQHTLDTVLTFGSLLEVIA